MTDPDINYNGLNYFDDLDHFWLEKAPSEVLKELKPHINLIQENFSNSEGLATSFLAGEIEHEYFLDRKKMPVFLNYIRDVVERSDKSTNFIKRMSNNTAKELRLDAIWINFQQKYEYNPAHLHAGLYSWVLWYQIPFTFEEERQFSNKPPTRNSSHGEFHFLYLNPNNSHKISQVNPYIDKTKEGYFALFPSHLLHVVYPFYSSNDYRITISGNIFGLDGMGNEIGLADDMGNPLY